VNTPKSQGPARNSLRSARRSHAVVAALLVCLVTPALARADSFIGGSITINDQAVSTPFPATITVTTPETIVDDLNVRLRNLAHSFPEDVDVLLVGPRGQTVVLMSDAGAAGSASDTLTFDDQAPGPVPDTITSGIYRPTNVDDGLADFFPAPAPAAPFGTTLSDFNDVDPNGTWSLYVVDDELGGTGSISEWRLTMTQRRPAEWVVARPYLREGESPTRLLVHRSFNAPGTWPLHAGGFNWELRGCDGLGSSATPGVDFPGASGRVEFAAGETDKFIDIPVTDDRTPEESECIVIFTSAAEGDLAGSPFGGASVGGSIVDNDPKAAPPLIARSGVQRVLRQRAVIVKATSNADGTLSGRGTITLPRGPGATVRLKAARKQVTAGQPTKLRLGLSRAALRKVRLALAKTRKLTARVTVTAKDLAGNQASKLVRVRLRR
jgi:subtilisin-like proprotein convertase family protein